MRTSSELLKTSSYRGVMIQRFYMGAGLSAHTHEIPLVGPQLMVRGGHRAHEFDGHIQTLCEISCMLLDTSLLDSVQVAAELGAMF